MSNQAYKWFRSTELAEVQRCKALIDKVHGDQASYIRTGEHIDPALHGTPVAAGPDAAPNNTGCQLMQSLYDSIVAGTAPNITSEERDELLAFFERSEPVEQNWFEPPSEPDEF